ncbi:MAG: DUF952 domain-containing protein [Anaerolineae bacterium]|nr:DUF952 domain-containing protein [Anaerolineae bacterium]MCI0611253.1 DUF952 domain-containing protein [Anaerolineae bacterium]
MIFHITSRTEWEEAQQRGDYRAESLATEGFIHCSTPSQVLPVAENFYKGQSGLILLIIEPTLLSSTLKWEPPSGGTPPAGVPEGDSFPHVYGPINLNAVIKVLDFEPNTDGMFTIPANL